MSRIADALQKAGMPTVDADLNADRLALESFEAVETMPLPAAVRPETPKAEAAPATEPPATVVPSRAAAVLTPTAQIWPEAMRTCMENERLVVSRAAGPVATQQYRKVASTLHQLQIERNLRSVLVTSAVAAEGKSISAANLALTLSESFSRRVLLVDADLRRPSQHKIFGATSAAGLSAVLSSAQGDAATLIGVSEHLSLLTAGELDGDPVGVLTGERMRGLLDDAALAFDWVIVDSPPVGLFPDAELLSMLVDGVLMVVRAGSTSLAHVRRAVTTLTPERIVGAILNQTEKLTLVEHGYYDERYYNGVERGATVSVAGLGDLRGD